MSEPSTTGGAIPSALSRTTGTAHRRGGIRDLLPPSIMLAILLALSLPPLVVVVVMSFQGGILTATSFWTFEHYGKVFDAARTAGPIVNSVIYAFGSSCLALLVGGVLAFVTERVHVPLRRLGYLTALLVVAIPAPVYAFAWTLLFGRTGPINHTVEFFYGQFGAEFEPLRITNMAGMILVEGLNYSALAFFLLIGPMRAVDRSLEEAATMSGARAWQTFRLITEPLVRPAVLAVLILTFIRAMESFAVPAMIGVPGNVDVLTTEIYYAVSQQQPPEYGLASAYGVVLVATVVLLLIYYTSVTAQASRYTSVTGKGYRARIIELGNGRYLLAGLLVVYFLVIVLLPVGMLGLASLQPFYAGVSFTNLSFENYQGLLGYREIVESFANSFVIGLCAALAIMAIGLTTAWFATRYRGRTARLMDIAVSLPLALPGTVLGLALLVIFARIPLPLYGTLLALIIATIIRFLPYGFRYAHAGLLQIHSELEEAAIMSGATRLQAMIRVVLPLMALPLIAGFTYVFLIGARELEASALLVTSNTPIIAPVLIDLYQNGYIPQLAAFSTTLVGVYGLGALILFLGARRYSFGVY